METLNHTPMEYLLDILKSKEEWELIRIADMVQMVQRWKRNPALSLEPIYVNGNLTFKNPPLDEMIKNIGKGKKNGPSSSAGVPRRSVLAPQRKTKIPPIAAE